MKNKLGIVVALACFGVGLLASSFWQAHAQTYPAGFGAAYNQQDQKIFFQGTNPGWCAPGSLWINNTNGQIFVQTNLWNTNGIAVLSNIVISGTSTSITIAGTNIYPKAGWATAIPFTNAFTWVTNQPGT